MKKLLTSAALCILMASGIQAKMTEVKVKVSGIHCDYCAYSLGKHLTKLPDVQSASVDVKKGTATMMLEGKTPLKLTNIQKALKYTPFDVKNIEIVADGKVVKQGSHYFFDVKDNPYRIYLMQKDVVPAKKEKPASFFGKVKHAMSKAWESTAKSLSSAKKLEDDVFKLHDSNETVQIHAKIHNHCDGYLGLATPKVRFKGVPAELQA